MKCYFKKVSLVEVFYSVSNFLMLLLAAAFTYMQTNLSLFQIASFFTVCFVTSQMPVVITYKMPVAQLNVFQRVIYKLLMLFGLFLALALIFFVLMEMLKTYGSDVVVHAENDFFALLLLIFATIEILFSLMFLMSILIKQFQIENKLRLERKSHKITLIKLLFAKRLNK